MWPFLGALKRLATTTKAQRGGCVILLHPRVGVRAEPSYACAIALSIKREQLSRTQCDKSDDRYN